MKCPRCGKRVRVNKDGTITAHYRDDTVWWRVPCSASARTCLAPVETESGTNKKETGHEVS